MILEDFYAELFKKEHLRMQKIIVCLEEQEDVLPEEALKIAAHIINSQHIWLNHLKYKKAESNFWDLPPLYYFHRLNNQNLTEMLDFLNKDFFLLSDETIESNRYDQKYQLNVLHYILEHAAYHRGQLILCLKNHQLNIPSLQLLSID